MSEEKNKNELTDDIVSPKYKSPFNEIKPPHEGETSFQMPFSQYEISTFWSNNKWPVVVIFIAILIALVVLAIAAPQICTMLAFIPFVGVIGLIVIKIL